MAKQISGFEIIIRGSESGGPTQMFIKYSCEDSTNTDLKSRKSKEIASPDFNKTAHNAGSAGELWFDQLAIAKTDEGI